MQYRRAFASLKVGDVTVTNPLIEILPDAAEASFWRNHTGKIDRDPIFGLRFQAAPIILGMDILRKLHLYVAYGEKTLYVTPANDGIAEQNNSESAQPNASR